jgi:hypothetical protein
MAKLTQETAQKVIADNRKILYHIPKRYKYLNYFLGEDEAKFTALRMTLFAVYKFLSKKEIMMYRHMYVFMLDTDRLTYKVRKKAAGRATTNRHMNMLCAIGLLRKEKQSIKDDILLNANRKFLKECHWRERPINVYSFRRYDKKQLEYMEERAKRLYDAGITCGNFCQSILTLHGLEDIANEVLPANDKTAPMKKSTEYQYLRTVLDFIIEEQGYCTKQQLLDNLEYSDKEIEKLFRIFKQDIQEEFYYKRPTKQQMTEWNLKSLKYIFTRRA